MPGSRFHRQGAPDLPQIYCAPRGGCGALNEFQHEQPPCGVVVRRLEPVVYRGPNEIDIGDAERVGFVQVGETNPPVVA